MSEERTESGEPIIFNKPEGLETLTSHLLDQLDDIVTKYGQIDQARPERRQFDAYFYHPETHSEDRLLLSKSLNPTSPDLMVGVNRPFTEGSDMVFTNKGDVFWDRIIPAEYAKRVVGMIDDWAKENDLIDPETGKRREIPADSPVLPGPRIPIDQFFTGEHRADYVTPGTDPQERLRRFDHPDQLMTQDFLGDVVIHKKEDEPYLRKRRMVTLQLLNELGVSSPEHGGVSQYGAERARRELIRRKAAGETFPDEELMLAQIQHQMIDELSHMVDGRMTITKDHNEYPETDEPFPQLARIAAEAPVGGNKWTDLVKFYELPENLKGKVMLDICSGESDFTVWLRQQGAEAYALDYLYDDPTVLKQRRIKNLLSHLPPEVRLRAASLPKDDPRWNLLTDENTEAFRKSFQEHPEWYIAGSAHKLPFPNDHFDIITSSYGIFGVMDMDRELLRTSLTEALRVLKPGGTLQLGPWSEGAGLEPEELRNQKDVALPLFSAPGLTLERKTKPFNDIPTGLIKLTKHAPYPSD